MKLITFTVPCYNSAAYMEHCIQTLLPAGEEAEIILVDDGSSDETGAIADTWAEKYPTIIRAIHQENGGHGEGVNQGIRNASGLYFKVVDSDDWLDADALQKVMTKLREFAAMETPVDLLLCNYVYEHTVDNTHHTVRYTGILPEDRPFTWAEIGHFPQSQNILMHSVIYRTQVLRDCGLDLPLHTFYVDNLFVYVPMTRVKTLYYVDRVFYHYFIGREDQSVQEAVMIRRINQQLKVNWLMFQQVDLDQVENQRLRRYLLNYLEIVTTVSCVLLYRSGTPEHLEMERRFWQDMERDYPRHYALLSRRMFGRVLGAQNAAARRFTLAVYRLSQKIFGFN